MYILSEELKECLRLAIAGNPELDFADTTVEGIKLYAEANGPIQIEDDDEGYELFQACTRFILDEVITELILKGLIEVKGIDENGDLVYGLTQWENNGGPVIP